MEHLSREEAARRQELEAIVRGNEAALGRSIAGVKSRIATDEAQSRNHYKRETKAFTHKLQTALAEQLAKAEAERERCELDTWMKAGLPLHSDGASPPQG